MDGIKTLKNLLYKKLFFALFFSFDTRSIDEIALGYPLCIAIYIANNQNIVQIKYIKED